MSDDDKESMKNGSIYGCAKTHDLVYIGHNEFFHGVS